MKKYLSLLVALSLVLTSFSVFAAVENDYVLTPDDGEVPYPPEVTINSQVIVTPLPIDEKNITLEEAEKSKIWEEYGYTKEEFDNFPESLRLAMLYEPEQIGISYDVPTRKDLAEWEEKERNVILESNSTRSTANQLNSEYAVGGSYAHYICIFGYDPDDSTVFIEDSHNTHSIHMFRANYSKVAKACQRRGIIW